ncbi:MAG: acyl-CoA dehydrogenase [Pseudomonadota bacterium]
MNFDLGEEKALKEKIKGLFDADAMASLSRLEKEGIQQLRKTRLIWLKRLARIGYLTLDMDKGKNSVPLVVAQESLASISPLLFLSVEMSARLFGRLLAVYGSWRQREEILNPLTEGRIIGTVALSEDGADREGGEEGYLISGKAQHVINAPVADWMAIPVMEKGSVGICLIQKGGKGLSIGESLQAIGYNGVAASISFDHCPVPSEFYIGPFEGIDPLGRLRMWEDQILTVASLGLMHRSFDTALGFAKTHARAGKPLIAHQEFGFKLAEMLTLLQTSQLLTYRAAWMAEADDREETVLTHCAKVFCSESAERVASYALQILGKEGFFQMNPAGEGYGEAKYLQIAGTGTEFSRMKIGDILLEYDK